MQNVRFELRRSSPKADLAPENVAFACAGGSEIPNLHITSYRPGPSGEILKFRVLTNFVYENDERNGLRDGEQESLVGVGIDFHVFTKFTPRLALRAPSKPVEIRDNVVAELAHGLFHLGAEVGVSSRAVTSMVCMLCERLACAMEHSELLSPKSFRSWQSAEIAQVLSDELGEDVPVEIIAARCRLSVCHFARLFKAVYGMPFHKFRVKERIRTAQTRLAFSEDAISSIALDCGFSDQACLTRRFTSVVGVSPAIWRKRARHNQNVPLPHVNPSCLVRQIV